MSLLIAVCAFIVAGFLFYYPLEDQFVWPMQLALFILIGVEIILESFHWLRFRLLKEGREETGQPETQPTEAPHGATEAGIVQFLGRLQDKGRFIDFVMDDVTPYSNEQIGAAARVVHQGCREVLKSNFDFEPVHGGKEGETITLSEDFDARAYRLTGKVPDRPPYKGAVRHRGWKITRISLPRLTGDVRDPAVREIAAPAEVEIG